LKYVSTVKYDRHIQAVMLFDRTGSWVTGVQEQERNSTAKELQCWFTRQPSLRHWLLRRRRFCHLQQVRLVT